MTELTDKQKLGEGGVMCVCGNVIPIDSSYCPYCKQFNASGSVKECPLCGGAISKIVE